MDPISEDKQRLIGVAKPPVYLLMPEHILPEARGKAWGHDRS